MGPGKIGVSAALLLLGVGCVQDHDLVDLAGGDGRLRFNLEFTNETMVDLDLHVLTPHDVEIYWEYPEDGTGGQLDVDCFCDNCEEGPFENVFWDDDTTPPEGRYTAGVFYYGACDLSDTPRSTYTLRILLDGEIVETHEGELGFYDEPPLFTYEY